MFLLHVHEVRPDWCLPWTVCGAGSEERPVPRHLAFLAHGSPSAWAAARGPTVTRPGQQHGSMVKKKSTSVLR